MENDAPKTKRHDTPQQIRGFQRILIVLSARVSAIALAWKLMNN